MLKKLILLLLVISPALFAQTSVNGRVQVGSNAVRLTQVPNPGDQWNTNDGHGGFICIVAGVWAAIGGGGTNYQTIETAGVPLVQEPILNFVNVPCADNPGSTRTDCTVSYQFVLNNANVLPQEPRINCVPPLSCVDNAANTRTDLNCPSAIGVGGSHSSGCVPDPGAVGTTTDYLGRDMLYHASGSASTVKPDPSSAVLYVSLNCNGGGACTDANDGLSLGTAKLTIYNALCSLPGGNCGTQTFGAGTVYFTQGVSANPTSGAGIWLMGPNDPSFNAPPVGWLKSNVGSGGVAIIGYAPNATDGPNGHDPKVNIIAGSNADRNHPSVWLSATGISIRVENLFAFAVSGQPGRSLVIGECSNNNRTGTCQSAGAYFKNDSFVSDTAGASGPAADITGTSFWFWFEHCGFNGNAYSASGGRRADNAAAILMDGSYLIHVFDSNFAAGGIKVKNGAFGSSVYVKDATQEGDFAHALPPLVWFTATSWSVQQSAVIENAKNVDGIPGSDSTIENDALWGNGGPTVINSDIPSGPASIINPDLAASTGTLIPSPMRLGQFGVANRYLVGQTNVARRLAGLTSARFANKATTTPTWTSAPASSGVSTAATTDSYGGNQAGIITTTSGNQNMQLGFDGSYTPAAGDWLVAGVHERNWNQVFNGLSLGSCPSLSTVTFSAIYLNNGALTISATSSSDQDDFVWIAAKVASQTGNNACFMALTSAGQSPVFYGPVMFEIPAAAMSDDEVLEFASTMNSLDANCAVGSICNVNGHPVSVDTLNLRFNAFTGTLTPGTLTGNRTYTFPDASGTVPMFTGAITGGNNVCASGTAGLITTIGCTGGGGGGNVTNGLLNSFAIYTAPGTSNQLGPVAGPTTPANVTQFLTYTPNGTVSGAPTVQLAGIPVRTNNNNSDTIFATDRNTLVAETFAGNTAVAVSSLLFNNGFAFKLAENSTNVNASITLTPSTGTCNGASTCTLLAGQWGTFTLDATGSNLLADIHNPTLTQGSGILITPGQYSWSISAPGAVGTTGSPVAGNLTKFSAATTITNGDLSGDCTTSGTLTITCQKVNGVSYGAGGALGSNLVPVTNGVSSTTYTTVPNAALTNSATTPNGQTCTLGSTCNVNVGAAAHGIALNEGNGSAISGIAVLTTNQIPVGVSAADPVAGNLSTLSATMHAVDNGAVNVMTACPSPAPAAYVDGQFFEIKPNHSNTIGTPTLNICGLGAINVTSFSTVLNNADIVIGVKAFFFYDGTNMELQNPQTNKISTPPTWDAIGNAANNKTFANGGFTTTFGQTSNVAWTWSNTTAATNATLQPSPTHVFSGQYCTVITTCGSAADTWTITPALGSATNNINPPSTLTFTHAGSTGQAYMDFSTGRFTNGATNTVPMNIDAITGQTADIADFRVNGTRLAWVANDGGINSNVIITANRFTSNVATGTAPFTVSSTTNVANLNASSVGGITLGTPVAGGIGYGTSTTQIGTTAAGTAKQIVLSGGTGAPTMITFPETKFAPAANCVNGSAGSVWSTGATPAALCRAGTNNKGGLLSPWGASDVGYVQFHIPADADLTTQLPSLLLEVTTTESSTHTIIMQESVSCAKEDGSTTDDVAFNAARSFATVTETSRANQVFDTTINLNSTDLTGCTAPGIMNVKISRTTDTATNVGVYGLNLTIYRLLTVQAN